MWQIGVLAAERRVFWAKKWPISAVSHYVLSEKFSGRLCANDRFCGRVIATLKIPEYTGIYSIRRTAAVLTPQTLKSHKNGPKFAPFPHKNANLPHCTSWKFIGFLDNIIPILGSGWNEPIQIGFFLAIWVILFDDSPSIYCPRMTL